MKVNVVSPWYPDEVAIYSGIFVKDQVQAVESLGAEVTVEVPAVYPAPAAPVPTGVFDAMRELAGSAPQSLYKTEGSVVWIPSPVPSRSGMTGRSVAFRESIRMKRSFLPLSGDVTHAHLGVPTAWAVMGLDQQPLIVTEHQSTLADLLGRDDTRELYRQVLDHAAAFICVSAVLKELLLTTFGGAANDVLVIPNIVDLAGIPFTPRPGNAFSKWIYVGGIAEHKGVMTLLRAFAAYRSAYDPKASLLIVGEGNLRSWVASFAEANRLGDSVEMIGAIPREELGTALHRSDVMVHLSPYETFGLASLEAIGAGLPVITLNNGGVESTWADHETSCGRILAKDTSPGEIAAAAATLRDDGSGLDAAAGRDMVVNRFSSDTVGRQLMEAYEKCLSR